MSDYQGKGRSSFVQVTDKAKVIKIAELYDLEYEIINERIAFFSTNNEGEARDLIYIGNDYDVDLAVELGIIVKDKVFDSLREEYDLPSFLSDVIADYLCDDEVFVWKHSGCVKYEITGYAVAINNKKESKYVYIDDIFDLAKALGTRIVF